MEEYYYFDGQKVLGPHNLRELQELYSLAVINSKTQINRKGDKDWLPFEMICDLNAPECQPLELDDDYFASYAKLTNSYSKEESPTSEQQTEAQTDQTHAVTVMASDEEQESIREEDEAVRQHRTTQHQLLRQIRSELDALWEAQRESIISRIRFEQLDKGFEATRKRNREIFRFIEENALEYWRRSGLLTACIRDLTWREHDFTVRLRGKNESDKYAYLQSWLEETRLASLSGCYCFKSGREYIYVGQANILKDRIKQHEKKTYFTYASSVRIIIPRNKRQLNQLERLLILTHQPTGNGTSGIAGRTPIDDCLDFIKGEIKELVTDF